VQSRKSLLGSSSSPPIGGNSSSPGMLTIMSSDHIDHLILTDIAPFAFPPQCCNHGSRCQRKTFMTQLANRIRRIAAAAAGTSRCVEKPSSSMFTANKIINFITYHCAMLLIIIDIISTAAVPCCPMLLLLLLVVLLLLLLLLCHHLTIEEHLR